MIKIQYRSEIDGLRALAVLAVIFYHASFSFFGHYPFQGGFIGVDIFFVISGYLITLILLKEVKMNLYSFARFYERRARRILPTLFFVMLFSYPIAWVCMFPDAFKEYVLSLIASTLFVSNFFFWHLDGYTSQAAPLSPFLHTWSLAVEEQFYIIFPVLLYFLRNATKKKMLVIFSVLFLLSFLFSLWANQKYVNTCFFLLPGRSWELLAGCIMATSELNNPPKSRHNLNTLMCLIGFTLISIGIIFLNDHLPYPGTLTLLPVIGTMLLIRFSGKVNDPVSKLLRSSCMVSVGLISYSLYLWHQPIFAFVRILSINELNNYDKGLCIALTFIFSIFTWFIVETLFRDKQKINKTILWGTLSFATSVILTSSLVIVVKNGIPQRFDNFPSFVLNDTPKKFPGIKDGKGEYCHNRDPDHACIFDNSNGNLVILGDSHARVFSENLYPFALKNNLGFVELTQSGCAFLPDTNLYIDGKKDSVCTSEYQNKRVQVLSKLNPSIIIIHAGRLPMYLSGTGFNNGEGGTEIVQSYKTIPVSLSTNNISEIEAITHSLKSTIDQLITHGHRIVLIYPVPEVGWIVPQTVAKLVSRHKFKRLADARLTTNQSAFNQRTKLAYQVLNNLGASQDLIRVFPESIFCNKTKCFTHDNKNLFYVDSHHLSKAGNQLILTALQSSIPKKWLDNPKNVLAAIQ